jgi:hypothetical protein
MKQLGRNEAKFDYKEAEVDETDIEDLDKEEYNFAYALWLKEEG